MAEELIAGRYRLIEPLGRGAMSSVWLAQDEELQRRVAVKMLAPSADRARFEREARAAAALSHPHIAALYDYGEADERPYMVLEYLPNGSLEERLKDGRPLDDAEALRIATEMAAGLAHAHDRDLVHRDLKPANVLFDAEDRAKIADFGIARMGGSGTLTEAGTVLGTASYISPEQASGQPAGPASDVYSFGVILFRMLTGRLPFVSTNAMELVRMHRDDPPPAVGEFRDDAPARLESVTAAALAKDPADRPVDGSALLGELRGGVAKGTGGDATMVVAAGAIPPPSDATQVMRPVRAPQRRRRRVLWLAPLVLVLLGGGVALALLTTGGGGGTETTNPLTGLSLPSVPTAGSTEPTTAATSTTAATTAAALTTTAPTTTRRVTTVPITPTAPPTVLPTTTVAPAPTTTAAPPPTTTAPPTTTDTTAAPPPTTAGP